MKVFFDYAIFTHQRFGGVSNYIVNLVENFSEQVDPLIISLFYKNHYLKKSNFADKIFFYNRVGFLIKYVNRANKIYFNHQLKNKKPDIIHLTYFNEKNFYVSKAKKVITEYDLIKEKFYADKYKSQIEYKKKIFEKVDQIICISNNTKKDLQQEYSIEASKISVVNLAVNKDKSFRERFLNVRPFILYVGSRQKYKNFISAIKAYARSNKLKLNFDFVCFGGGNFLKNEEDLFRDLSLDRSRIHYFEGDDLDLNYFYHKARLFIFPSLYEGFGLPLLEAMNMECPVICSDTSCFPEIVNDAAILFDPTNIESLEFKMEKLIYDDKLLLNLKKKGNENLNKYSWKKCANETEQLYKKII
jgi:glycosyltransferase involved in cell wall biosynthesis